MQGLLYQVGYLDLVDDPRYTNEPSYTSQNALVISDLREAGRTGTSGATHQPAWLAVGGSALSKWVGG
jgi:hypothetical protein